MKNERMTRRDKCGNGKKISPAVCILENNPRGSSQRWLVVALLVREAIG